MKQKELSVAAKKGSGRGTDKKQRLGGSEAERRRSVRGKIAGGARKGGGNRGTKLVSEEGGGVGAGKEKRGGGRWEGSANLTVPGKKDYCVGAQNNNNLVKELPKWTSYLGVLESQPFHIPKGGNEWAFQ